MKITVNLRNKIEELYKASNKNIKSVGIGHKETSGNPTGEHAIVFRVQKKKPPDQLSEEEKIPSTINVDGEAIITDVIEDPGKLRTLECFTTRNNPNILKLQGDPQLITPVKGGQEIVQYPTGFSKKERGIRFFIGTLGFLGVDSIDGKVVGITNNHVVCYKGTITQDRALDSEVFNPYNIIEPTNWIIDNQSHAPGAQYRDKSDTSNNAPFVLAAEHIKRYIPVDLDETNYVDVALLIMDPNKIDATSYQIHQPNGIIDHTPHLSFANTTEIDSLVSTSRTIYSTGRSTGPKGWGSDSSCTLKIIDMAVSTTVKGFAPSGALFSDVVSFGFSDGSDFPIDGGDSGSAVIADFDGVRKIVGLVFAGNVIDGVVNTGYFCRIDRIADAIKIRAWDSNYTLNSTLPSPQIVTDEIESPTADDAIISPECRFLFQVGTTLTDTFTKLDSIKILDCVSTENEVNAFPINDNSINK